MDSQTKLTPEQVAGFEARAAAGERLVMPWWMKSSDDYVWLDMKNHFGPSVCFDKEGEANPTLVVIGDGHEGLIETTFSTIIAAQLAAEHLLAEATLPIHASALASRDGEIAALREEVRSTNSHLAGNRVNLATMFDLKETYRARAEAAEARANIAETDFWRLKNEAAAECSRLTDRVAALEAALAEAREVLESFLSTEYAIAAFHQREKCRCRECVQTRARAIVDAARAGGQG